MRPASRAAPHPGRAAIATVCSAATATRQHRRERSNSCSSFFSTPEPVLTAVPSSLTVRSEGGGDYSAVPTGADARDVGERAAASAVVVAVAAADEEGSINVGDDAMAASGDKKRLPLSLQPLAGRCCFENCGEVCMSVGGPGAELPRWYSGILVLSKILRGSGVDTMEAAEVNTEECQFLGAPVESRGRGTSHPLCRTHRMMVQLVNEGISIESVPFPFVSVVCGIFRIPLWCTCNRWNRGPVDNRTQQSSHLCQLSYNCSNLSRQRQP